jgi:MFS family permease
LRSIIVTGSLRHGEDHSKSIDIIEALHSGISAKKPSRFLPVFHKVPNLKPTDDNQDELPTIATVPNEAEGEARRVIAGNMRWSNAVAALRHRNFRLFFFGSAISLIGTWMQTVAEGWLVYSLTSSPMALGLVRFLHTVPVTGLTIVGGAIADRMDKRRILTITQFVSMFLALLLGALVLTDSIQLWHVAIIGLALGVAHSFDIPARQSFIIEMVGKKDLMNAIALNSSMFNGARVIGPAIAGVLIGITGVGICFLINGFSYIAVIAAYLAMRLPKFVPHQGNSTIRQAMMEAVRFVMSDRVIRSILLIVATVSLFGWPFSVLMPDYAVEVLHLKGTGYGFLMATNGAGAFLGAVSLMTIGNYSHKGRLLFFGLVVFCLSLIGLSLVKTVWLAATLLALIGWSMILFFATANTLIQLSVPNSLRGRVMGIYSFCFIGISPFGSLLAGFIAKSHGSSFVIGSGAVVCLLVGLVVFASVLFREPKTGV